MMIRATPDSDKHPAVLQIKSQLLRYISGKIRLNEFEAEFTPLAWNIGADALVNSIDLALAEFDHGDWTEDELKQLFKTSLTMWLSDV